MTLRAFAEYIEEHIAEYLPEDTSVRISDKLVNNGKKLVLEIRKKGETVAPAIHLNEFHSLYQSGGKSLGEILENIAEMYERAYTEVPQSEFQLHFDYETIRDRVAAELLEIKRNPELLSERLYTPVGNGMAKIYKIILEMDEDGIKSVPISRELADRYGYDLQQLEQDADKNTERLLPITFTSLTQEIARLTGIEIEEPPKGEDEIYVLTNKVRIGGAVALYLPEVKERISELLGGRDYYAIPSSTHEMIIIPDDGVVQAEVFEQMIQEVNHIAVPEDEILSEHVLYYDHETKELTQPMTRIPSTPQKKITDVSWMLRDLVKLCDHSENGRDVYIRGELPAASLEFLIRECKELGISEWVSFDDPRYDAIGLPGLADQFDLTPPAGQIKGDVLRLPEKAYGRKI